MQIFYISNPGRDVEPLELKGKMYLELGEEGRGRCVTSIPIIDSQEGGKEYALKKVNDSVVIVKGLKSNPDENDTRCILDVNCVGSYDRSRNYDLHNPKNITIVATGTFAFGEAGGVNGGPNHLLIAEKGAEFMLKSKYSAHWYIWDGENWKMLSTAEYLAQQAINQFEKGEGEWL